MRAQSEAFWGTISGTSDNNTVAIKSEPTNVTAGGKTAPPNPEPTHRNINVHSRQTSDKTRNSTVSIKSKLHGTIGIAAPRNQEFTDRNIRDTAKTSSSRARISKPRNTATEIGTPFNQEPTNVNKRDPTSTPSSVKQSRSSIVTIKPESLVSPTTGVAACHNQNLDVGNRGNLEESASTPTVKTKPDSETHIIFAIDFSGSMKSRDVQKGPGQEITRWDAVFECIPIILDGQCNDEGVGDNVVVSLIIFNNQAETLLERMPLVGDGQKVQRALNTAHKQNKPCGGTGFSAGLQRAKTVALKNIDSKITLVFLSDGRPGDLQPKPPAGGNPMQPTFKQNGKTHPSAAVHLEEMKHQFGNRFNLQLVCLCQQGKPVSMFVYK